MQRKQILLVDDSKNDRELILHALTEQAHFNEVTAVQDGEEALDYLYQRGKFHGSQNTAPAVILLDLKMPKVDGITVLKEIKSDNRLRDIPVVVLTSSREDSDLSTCYQLGANAYVVKSTCYREFVDSVQRIGHFWTMVNEPPSVS